MYEYLSDITVPPSPILSTDEYLSNFSSDRRSDYFGFFTDPNDPLNNVNEFREVEKNKLTQWYNIIPLWHEYFNGVYPHISSSKNKQLKILIRKGIPNCLRGLVWSKLLNVDQLTSSQIEFYSELLTKDLSADIVSVIQEDLRRTFPHNHLFSDRSNNLLGSLKRVLLALAAHSTDVSYCQGMGFIVGTILLHLPEVETFYASLEILYSKPYKLAGFYSTGMPLTRKFTYILFGLLEKYAPEIRNHFINHTIDLEIFNGIITTRWFSTMFIYDLPFDCVLRLIDSFFMEGNKVLIRVALSTIIDNKETLLKYKYSHEIINYLQHHIFDNYSKDALFDIAFKFNLKRKTMKDIGNRWNHLQNDVDLIEWKEFVEL
eukprot:TRINITY_DN3176_c3_g15_i1.p1 TRINITY_DN3176_c3_g15~~TRINITY_DN3176_c3_g15_i1.p1  ORF type:complete len:374 (+),score=65.77 TRINITY_DN3176_c3_g15_i1:58-1179(+)